MNTSTAGAPIASSISTRLPKKHVKRGELNTLRTPRISLPESPKGSVLNSIDTLPIFATELVNYKSDACFVDMEDKTCAFP